MTVIHSAEAALLLYTIRGALVALIRRDDTDLTARQLSVFLVCYSERDPQTVRGLAEKLKVNKPAITRVLDRLEAAGLIRRQTDPSDRRSVLTAPTVGGKAFFRQLRQIMADAAKAVQHAKVVT